MLEQSPFLKIGLGFDYYLKLLAFLQRSKERFLKKSMIQSTNNMEVYISYLVRVELAKLSCGKLFL